MAAPTSKPGGRRPGQGRPSAFRSEESIDLLQAAALEICKDADRLRKVIDVVFDAATGGGRVLSLVKWTGQERRIVVGEEECKRADGSVVYLYRVKPDIAAAKLILELGLGKAPTRSAPVQDTEIRVVTGVPRGRPMKEEDEGEDADES